MTSETSSAQSGTPRPENRQASRARRFGTAFLACLALAATGGSCVRRNEIRAVLWLNLSVPEETCQARPELRDRGIYRLLNDGRYEFVSFCSPLIKQYFSVFRDDLERILRETLPRPEADRVMAELNASRRLDREAMTSPDAVPVRNPSR